MPNYRQIRFRPLFFLLLLSATGFGQTISESESYRKHFLIFYDVSYPHYSKEEKLPSVKKSLVRYFDNKATENRDDQVFFDPNRDQISFYHFGINEEDKNYLKRSKGYLSRNKILYSTFKRKFITSFPDNSWSSFKGSTKNKRISNYFNQLWSIKKPRWKNGLTFSYLIYPFGLDVVQNSYAEEYIIVVISDFKTGSDFGNKADLDLMKRFFGQSYYYDQIISEYDALKNKFYRIDYFEKEFAYQGALLGFVAYKVKPKVGVIKPEDSWLSFDSDISIIQKDYADKLFALNPQSIKFSHNDSLSVSKIKLSVADKFGNILEETEVDYSVSYDKNGIPIYNFPERDIALKNIKSFPEAKEKGSDSLNLNYTFFTKYQLHPDSSLSITFKTPERTKILSADSFKPKPKQKNHAYMYLLIIPLLALVIAFLAWLGKPKKVKAECSAFSDSLESLKNNGEVERLLTEYLPVTLNENSGFADQSIVTGSLKYRENTVFPWKNVKIKAELYIELKPENLDIFLKRSLNKPERAYPQEPLVISNGKNNFFEFYICYESNDPNFELIDPQEVKIRVHLKTYKTVFFIPANAETEIYRHFQIGPDLGSVWVGIDPGTTGTCIAASNSPSNIYIGKEIKTGEEIMPSVISFNPDREFRNARFPHFATEGPDSFFRYGSAAIQRPDVDIKFQSVKKLLGYVDTKKISFADQNIALSGSKLTALLINGAYRGLEETLKNKKITFDSKDAFAPKRAVVAVPNNFTLTKIMDMIGAFEHVMDQKTNKKRFQEIRYIYEAEAITFYYLSNRKKYSNVALSTENILVFDMGGATINASVVSLTSNPNENGETTYDSDIHGKLGYSIGGDTIDYVLLKIFYEKSFKNHELHNLLKVGLDKNANPIKKNKLKQFALALKKEIIKNANENKKYILTTAELNGIIKNELSIPITLKHEDPLSKLFNNENSEYWTKAKEAAKVNHKNGYLPKEEYTELIKDIDKKLNQPVKKLYEHPLFVKYITNNITSAVDDVLSLANESIDTVIFSGRSVFFPKIKETVEKMVGRDKKVINLSFEEAKTAVAKGACWYGVAKSGISVNNVKTNGVFGFKQSKTGIKGEEKFVELIPFGQLFNSSLKTPKTVGKTKVKSEFRFDNHHVEFYQIMGKNAEEIISRDDMGHKRNKVARIRADQEVVEQSIEVYENDMVNCTIKLVTGKPVRAKNIISDMEITNENEEHYTWHIE